MFAFCFITDKLNTTETTKDPKCECKPYDKCQWSKNIVETISQIDNQNQATATVVTGRSFFAERVCNAKEKRVFCCDGNYYPPKSFRDTNPPPTEEVVST